MKRMDNWIHCSFTTVSRDDPTDPEGYYNTHYPLALNKIPRRKKKLDPIQHLNDLADRQPEVDMSFYDTVPMRRLSTPAMSCTTLEEMVDTAKTTS